MRRLCASAALFFSVALPTLSIAATLSVTAPASMNVGDTITARVYVDSKGIAINNAEAVLNFPTDILSIVSVSRSSSVFSLWVEEPSFSNAAGTMSFNGGQPNPGFTGSSGLLTTVTLRAKKSGSANLSLSNAAVRANDGLGTNVLTGSSGASIQIAAATPAQPAEAVPADTTAGPRPVIRSATHPNQDAWYADKNPRFEWELPSGVTAVQTGIGASPGAVPTVTYSPAVTAKNLDPLSDGTSYFKLRFRTSAGWGPIATYRLNIDTTAPHIPEHEVSYDASSKVINIRAEGTDALSGVAQYEILIDARSVATVSAGDMMKSGAAVSYSESGPHVATIVAVDGAGNRTSVDTSFTVPASLGEQILFKIGPLSITLMQAFLCMFILTLLSLGLAIVSTVRLHRLKSKLHREPRRSQ